jgi:hypothetical protein
VRGGEGPHGEIVGLCVDVVEMKAILFEFDPRKFDELSF